MLIELPVGNDRWAVTVREADFTTCGRGVQTPIVNIEEAVYTAMEHPLKFEPLRRALTPDDRIALVIDEQLPHLPILIQGVLKYIASAGISPESVAIISPAEAEQEWIDDLSDDFADIHAEIHQPEDRKKLSYLATLEAGRRVYMNRTVVDADQVIVLSGRRHHPLLGLTGGTQLLYPALSDDENQKAVRGDISTAAIKGQAPTDASSQEVMWLLGMPLFVHVIEGPNRSILDITAGLPETVNAAKDQLEKRWHTTHTERVDTVLATLCGDPLQHTFDDLARAAMAAARLVKPGGRVVLLTDADPMLGEGFGLLREADHAVDAIKKLTKAKPTDLPAALGWALSATQAKLFLASQLRPETVQEAFATPLLHPRELQAFLDQPGKTVHLPSAHLNWVTVEAVPQG